MLVLTQILRCGSGRQKEALTRLHWIHGLMASRSDSGGCIVARHLGNPIDYMILRFWQNTDAMMRRTNSYYQEPWPLFPPNEPEGIYQTQDIPHHFDEVLNTDGDASGGFIWRTTLRVNDGEWDRFIELRRQDDALMQQVGGLVRSTTFRSIHSEDEVFILVRLRDREAMEAIVVDPDRVAVELQLNQVTTPLEFPNLNIFYNECFEVVDESSR